jgi:hypothetical protein
VSLVSQLVCETSLLAEIPETRQDFFLFFPDFLFLPVVEPLVVLDAQKCVNTFFKDFLKLLLNLGSPSAPRDRTFGNSENHGLRGWHG